MIFIGYSPFDDGEKRITVVRDLGVLVHGGTPEIHGYLSDTLQRLAKEARERKLRNPEEVMRLLKRQLEA
jgi:hypothetical protein